MEHVSNGFSGSERIWTLDAAPIRSDPLNPCHARSIFLHVFVNFIDNTMADEALQETLALLKIVSLTDEDIKKGEVYSKEEAFEFIWSEIGKGS
ncbi:MAG: hypothetical protein ACE5IY_09605 [bacterium]